MFSPDRYVAAMRFAATRHRDQVVTGTQLPYVTHVVSVAAEVISAIEADPVPDPDLAVSCALLHDTIEDTPTRHDELAALFGTAVADGVQALTKDKHKPDPMADSLRRIRAQPREIWIVKLADRVTNLAPPPESWSFDKRRVYRAEALTILDALGDACAPLAARLRARADAYSAFC
jgi:(p)ppGpp synthase/HD superfamily hydrolase